MMKEHIMDSNYLSKNFDKNIQMFHKIFQEDTTIKFRHITSGKSDRKFCLLFADGMINNALINEHIIEPLLLFHGKIPSEKTCNFMRENILFSNDITSSSKVETLLTELLSGNTILLIEDQTQALILSTRGWAVRSISEPPAEKVLQGPREGFTETLLFNISMLRRKVCNPNLRFQFSRIGKQTNTMIAIAYIEGIADLNIVEEVASRIKKIQIDGILDANYIEELIKDSPYSPFKTIGSTERPDIITAKLLEGRVAIFVDGTPVVLTAPYFFIEYFQTNDDYYNNFYTGTFGRWLRMIGFWATVSLPALFLSLVTIHQELLPTRFLLNLAEARENLPFPTFLEMVLLILGFELIREGGAKVPANFGQTLGIVGGLVLGQAAVEAKLVSVPVLIVVAFTGVTGLMIPQLKSPVIMFRMFFLVLSAIWGFPGYLSGLIFLVLHLSSLKSFRIPYTSSLSTDTSTLLQDTIFRSPWSRMQKRPNYIAPKNRRRQSKTLPCILLFFFISCFFTGCASSTEINDVSIVNGITISKFPEEFFTISAQIASANTQSQESFSNVIGYGSSFESALKSCSAHSEKELYWNHVKSIAIEDNITFQDLKQIVDFTMEHPEIRITSDLVLMETDDTFISFDHLVLQKMMVSPHLKTKMKPQKIYQLFNRLERGDKSVTLPQFCQNKDEKLIFHKMQHLFDVK